jgi:protein SMG6
MLFTNIQLDDFAPVLARLMKRLEIDGAEEREWIMMAAVNVCPVSECGRPQGVVRRVAAGASSSGTIFAAAGVSGLLFGVAKMRIGSQKDETKVDGHIEGSQGATT